MFRPSQIARHTNPLTLISTSNLFRRSFSLSALSLADKPLPPRLKFQDADLTISYLKGTGPGGQKINKTNSAVQIIHKPTGIVVKSQATRSRSQNEKYARHILGDKVEELLNGDKSRAAIKADRARKKKASKVKKARRKYRELEKGQEGATEEVEGVEKSHDEEDDASNTDSHRHEEDKANELSEAQEPEQKR
ncbi:hypothetical protein ASPACDRAFT_124161 [Aspergillus aculeatus ATCC 16872]|uniref:Prokaryotic-type class I peptide chain release factors domain-containing protein n=1 Tax=Aspergillus aculeatus (strain ATCC 16872 / CBS 172.66 / WB 5094) TaxID=690307 RepID=A0A1L9WM86_ASPA1|nr:uncharacterized protein ASPACDRAFT_124161 [Aspergillus aculeatus ATCC 16872]OJJ97283.1 hypothetical protein ASPACDRAFT_124161 [Aspergillus aculeatus ATCC 16872]